MIPQDPLPSKTLHDSSLWGRGFSPAGPVNCCVGGNVLSASPIGMLIHRRCAGEAMTIRKAFRTDLQRPLFVPQTIGSGASHCQGGHPAKYRLPVRLRAVACAPQPAWRARRSISFVSRINGLATLLSPSAAYIGGYWQRAGRSPCRPEERQGEDNGYSLKFRFTSGSAEVPSRRTPSSWRGSSPSARRIVGAT